MRRTLVLTAAAALLAAPAHANPSDIGMTSATKNEVIVVSGADRRGLKIGDRVFQDQNIRTGADSAAQLLFLDETALTVGPNSSLVLDKAVFDPDKKVGELSVRAVSGAFRFVSGSSPSANYTIKTPAGTIGVRGTWLALRVYGDIIEILVRGGAIRFCNEALKCLRVGAGYRIRASRNVISPPIRASHETLESVVALWFGSGGDLAQLAPGAGPGDNEAGFSGNNQFWWQTSRDFQPDRSAQGSFTSAEPGAGPDPSEPPPKPGKNKFKKLGWIILHATLHSVKQLIRHKVDDREDRLEIRQELRPRVRELRRELKQVDTLPELRDFVGDVNDFRKDAKRLIREHSGHDYRKYGGYKKDGDYKNFKHYGHKGDWHKQYGHKDYKHGGYKDYKHNGAKDHVPKK